MTRSRADEVEALFRQGFSRSQAVIAVFAGDFGLERDTALKIAQGFGGGISLTDEICGALSGAVIVIGLRYGRTKAEDIAAKDRTYAAVQKFMSQFKERHNGETSCTRLVGSTFQTRHNLLRQKGRRLCRNGARSLSGTRLNWWKNYCNRCRDAGGWQSPCVSGLLLPVVRVRLQGCLFNPPLVEPHPGAVSSREGIFPEFVRSRWYRHRRSCTRCCPYPFLSALPRSLPRHTRHRSALRSPVPGSSVRTLRTPCMMTAVQGVHGLPLLQIPSADRPVCSACS
jgi:C_GCAxxG_C_C family probable redox protein